MSKEEQRFLMAIAAGILVAIVAENFVAGIVNPILTPLKLNF